MLSPKSISSKSVKRTVSFPVVTHEEVLSHAASSNTYARAEAYQDNIFDLNHGCHSSNGEDEFTVTCQCELQCNFDNSIAFLYFIVRLWIRIHAL